MSLFPSINSPQRLGASSPSSSQKNAKVPLRPGCSLMDWVRLTKSGKDLRGIGSARMLRITTEELAKHNKREDAWMAIRGFVYNVTTYLDYHPGGVPELMRGAGKDATLLFEEVHRWVNFESMLGACLIGKLEQGPPINNATKSKLKASSLLAPQASNAYKGLSLPKAPVFKETATDQNSPQIKISFAVDKEVPPRQKPTTSWFQNEEYVSLVCYSKLGNLDKRSCVVLDILEDGSRLLAEILNRDSCIPLDVKLSEPVKDRASVTVNSEVGKVEIKLLKLTPHKQWANLGVYGESHCKMVTRKNSTMRYRPCQLLAKSLITHDTSLYHFQLSASSHIVVPVGCHVYFEAQIEGIVITRPYTIVTSNIVDEDPERSLDGRNLYALIKTYEGGAVTSRIDKMQVGDVISVSSYEGSFNPSKLYGRSRVILLAAGTGFTPMVRLVLHCLRQYMQIVVHLEFFNKTTKDIPWREELQDLTKKYIGRFTVEHVLSQADNDWKGKRGRITLAMLREILKPFSSYDDEMLVCYCGPVAFTEITSKSLAEIGIKSENIHPFLS
uniref:Cytochrome b5 reductase 4 n=1 Tax=Phallusia mammillata TaxID=59560 RepID=A0A6F9DAX2_9ASCI|nr:cytochrome b5 reductase 4-like [Phallusia mammillata]